MEGRVRPLDFLFVFLMFFATILCFMTLSFHIFCLYSLQFIPDIPCSLTTTVSIELKDLTRQHTDPPSDRRVEECARFLSSMARSWLSQPLLCSEYHEHCSITVDRK